ncbi:aldehyde dehydrogenase family protein [Pseudoroseicyclus tamaricis]|uniref:Aldehyde dehydrogenase family protein n=1 Tax=Pseudoroseicyclus tamaricis TaxID=2705421 RepID=A0A6B2JNG6_9RHOB|nr:aldehyde dehydrogenase family protein [Pseudoroseicyclus tamaricis]NDV00227.1 aldehyde dehydrogenase family protein [Pseudoroseicyclus tamaricis]
MNDHLGQFYIDGAWVHPSTGAGSMGLIDPSTGEEVAELALGAEADAEAAIHAARAAFPGWTATPVAERIAALKRLRDLYEARYEDMAQAISLEMGAPIAFARDSQAGAGLMHLDSTLKAAESFEWESWRGTTRIVREGIGVCGLITPWNWPMNQIVCKVAPALVAGCTMVLKPSEIAPLSGLLFAELVHEAELPAGVFNLVNGTGPDVGAVLSSHPQVDMVSFTGSTRAGVEVARAAAPTVKRVAQELGGKSANIILPDADLEAAVAEGAAGVFANSGQSCDAPTRMLVPRAEMDRAARIAAGVAEAQAVGDPREESTEMGPVISQVQWDKIQGLIEAGIAEGATLAAGGPGLPQGLNRGYYVRPTVFADVTNGMRIAREEIFGPVLSILAYDSTDEAIAIANDTPYGLAAYVQGTNMAEVERVARQLRAGQIQINGPDWDTFAPFGGYKQSGNGREYADWAIHDFCETKALIGLG